MMNRCHVDFYLRGREEPLRCIWAGNENTSTEVANTILNGRREQDFYGLQGINKDHNVLVRIGDIVALDIYAM